MRIFAFLIGIFFLLIAIAGNMPHMTENGYLLKIFKVNLPINFLHLITGICGFLVCWIGSSASRLYFQIAGIIYAITAVLGFVYGSTNILGIFANDIANTWMHVIVAICALILGYGSQD